MENFIPTRGFEGKKDKDKLQVTDLPSLCKKMTERAIVGSKGRNVDYSNKEQEVVKSNYRETAHKRRMITCLMDSIVLYLPIEVRV